MKIIFIKSRIPFTFPLFCKNILKMEKIIFSERAKNNFKSQKYFQMQKNILSRETPLPVNANKKYFQF